MNEKELLRNLSALKSVTPSADWVKKNREQLAFQIFNGKEPAAIELGWFAQFSLVAHRLLQPAPIAALIALFFFISGGLGLRAAQKANPDDTLYIAKIMSEKLQGVATIDQDRKAELNLRFAQNRAAEMDELSKNQSPVATENAAELKENFKSEIASVRQQLDRINENQAKQAAIAAQTQAAAKLSVKAVKKNDKADNEEDSSLSVADSSKDDKGLDISLPGHSQKVLDEAVKLFDAGKYGEAATKLGQVKLK